MDKFAEKFQEQYGFSAPSVFLQFIEAFSGEETAPVRFTFGNKPFIFEVQYFLDVFNRDNFEERERRIAFAVNSDGHRQLADLSSSECEIYQDESGNIDALDLTLRDLLLADRKKIL